MRRLLLSARPATAGLAAGRGRSESRLRTEVGDRPAGGATTELSADPAVLRREVSGWMDAGSVAQSRHRTGRELPDGGEHGALLLGAGDRRVCGEAARGEDQARAFTTTQPDARSDGTAANGARERGAGGWDSGCRGRGAQGRAGGKDGDGAERDAQERRRAESRVVRG